MAKHRSGPDWLYGMVQFQRKLEMTKSVSPALNDKPKPEVLHEPSPETVMEGMALIAAVTPQL